MYLLLYFDLKSNLPTQLGQIMKIGLVQITFHFLWDHLAHCGIFENGVLLKYTLEG